MSEIISIFKTSIKNQEDKEFIRIILKDLPVPIQWSVDLVDEDRILRISAYQQISDEIIEVLQQYGFSCQLLESFSDGRSISSSFQ